MGVAGTNLYPRCSHCGRRRDGTEELRCPQCGRPGRRLLNGYCDDCLEKRAADGPHLSGARRCVVKNCPNYTDEERFIGDVCSPCWSFMITGRANSSWACRNVLREVSRMLGGKVGESIEKHVADAIFAAVSGADPTPVDPPVGPRAGAEAPAPAAEDSGVLAAKVDDLELSVRACNCLARLSVRTVGDLSRLTERELAGTYGVGRRTVQEIKEVLAGMGLSFARGGGS